MGTWIWFHLCCPVALTHHQSWVKVVNLFSYSRSGWSFIRWPMGKAPLVYGGSGNLSPGVLQLIYHTRALPLTRGSSQRCWITVPGDNTLKIDNYGFTKMIISPLIMVRFKKFKNWQQDSDPDLLNVSDITRNVTRPRWRHARKWRHSWYHPSNWGVFRHSVATHVVRT